jgi:hypothetical protein
MRDRAIFYITSAKGLISSTKWIFRYWIIVLVFGLILLSGGDSVAQPPPPNGTATPPCWPPPCIPIDGGISWLLAAGIVYGAKKSWDLGKKKDEEVSLED